jgi:hypothetical protein
MDVVMKYYNLKIGRSNQLADDWLAGNNPIGKPAAVIFFGKCTVQDIIGGKTGKQAKDFYVSSLPENRDRRLISVIERGKGWIVKPAGDIEEVDPQQIGIDDQVNIWKIIPVSIESKFSLKNVPHILAGINSNAYLGRGTYREIPYWGNIKAIHYVLGLPFPDEHLWTGNCTPKHLLECLSSLELETLIAKILEAAGCFVSAYRGGFIPDIDLFARNTSSDKINLDGFEIPPNERFSVQVKGLNRVKKVADSADYFIGLEVPPSDKSFDAIWIYKQVIRFPLVTKWLRESLSWLPVEFMQKYELW